jgi:hypothetical protein
MAPKPKLFYFSEEITGTKVTNLKVSWVPDPEKMFSIPWKLMISEEHR